VRTYKATSSSSPILVLGHGAGAGEDHPWMIRVGRGLARRGVTVVTFDFPYMKAGRRVPDKAGVLETAFETAYGQLVTNLRGGRRILAGGKSMGGRIASQVAAKRRFAVAPAGLVCLGYPLHPPGKADRRRDRHLPDIEVPVLFVHGTRDPFGSAAEMTSVVSAMTDARLELVDGGNHSLALPKRQDPESTSLDRAIERAAAWIADLR